MRTLPFAGMLLLCAGCVLLLPSWISRRNAMSLALALLGTELVLDLIFHRRLSRLVASRSMVFTLVLAPGTIIHELSHAGVVILTRAKLISVVLFRPDPATGNLGQVRYSVPMDRLAVVRGTLIGLAPYLGCGSVVLLLLHLLLPSGASWPTIRADDPSALVRSLVAVINMFWLALSSGSLPGPLAALVAFAALTIAQGAAPSGQDFESCFSIRGPLVAMLSIATLGAISLALLSLIPPLRHGALLVLASTAVAQVIAIATIELFALTRRLVR